MTAAGGDGNIQIMLLMHVPDLEEALAFFDGLLGFRTLVRITD